MPKTRSSVKSSVSNTKTRLSDRISSINTTCCRFDVIRATAESLGIQESADDWNIFWTDLTVNVSKCRELKTHQRINHFPGMTGICQKRLLARNLNRLSKAFPREYEIFPRTWCFKSDVGDVAAYARANRDDCFIVKPDFGCQGRGISLTKNVHRLCDFDEMICQLYIQKPFLIDGYKFDLRIYVLITSCDPLRMFVYNEGLARFATVKYEKPNSSNATNLFMHLTNYSVNKHSKSYVIDDIAGSKRKMSTVKEWLFKNNYDVTTIWDRIDDVIIKTVFAALPTVKHHFLTSFPNSKSPHACFEILGFDFLFDHELKPYLLEVNHSPSFYMDTKIDREVKEVLLRDAFVILNLQSNDRVNPRQDRVEWERNHMGNFRKIYPCKNDKYYEQFSSACVSTVFSSTVSSKAKERDPVTRPEWRERKVVKAKKVKTKKRKNFLRKKKDEDVLMVKDASVDEQNEGAKSLDASEIDDFEEHERISSKKQRDIVIESCGIVDIVYASFKDAGLLKWQDPQKKSLIDLSKRGENANKLRCGNVSSKKDSNKENKGVMTKLMECLSAKVGSSLTERAKHLFQKLSLGKNVGIHYVDADSTAKILGVSDMTVGHFWGDNVSFACEPSFIDEKDELDRKRDLEEREQLITLHDLHAQVFDNLKLAGLLKWDDQIKAFLSKRWKNPRSDESTTTGGVCVVKILERAQNKAESKDLKETLPKGNRFVDESCTGQMSCKSADSTSNDRTTVFTVVESGVHTEVWGTPEDDSEHSGKITNLFVKYVVSRMFQRQIIV